MAEITDFDGWVDGNRPENYEDVYCLYRSVINCEEWGSYSAWREGEVVFVDGPNEDILKLETEGMKSDFLRYLENRYCEEGMDMETWYQQERARRNL